MDFKVNMLSKKVSESYKWGIGNVTQWQSTFLVCIRPWIQFSAPGENKSKEWKTVVYDMVPFIQHYWNNIIVEIKKKKGVTKGLGRGERERGRAINRAAWERSFAVIKKFWILTVAVGQSMYVIKCKQIIYRHTKMSIYKECTQSEQTLVNCTVISWFWWCLRVT